MVMTEKQPVKPKLVHSDKPKVRPEPGTLEFDAWLLKRAKERAAKHLTDEHDLGDHERGILAGGYDRLLMSDEELAEEEKAMDQAQQQERRKHLKSVDSE
ncbi:TPA: hypothetical protein DCX24_14295 [Candidatus Azambacteria bacterium]|nr:hypothetical protein [Candidatus Azambacteria bacterium]|tara:strand:+ start:876 stop:1175 length:300 start_codon:yes stop_codon:yes gene_type:complete